MLNVADRTARGRFDDALLWRKRIDAVDGGALRQDMERINREPFINMVGFVHAHTEDPTAAAALAAIDAAPARDVVLVSYPVDADTDDPTTPPDQLVRLANALADPIRLRAMRELRDGPLSVTELAERLAVPRTSLTHHVRILTYAGLVTLSVDDGSWGQLELRDRAIADLVPLAERYILGRDRRPRSP
ncbi:MAG TPA: metalloregulator ArsR/SmtB family transcription factor [Candidatus Bathyarchaeia archaeon]|nr:metalloregulator ArsR/SmtB family transcription factor [Candidatus Bathyarchaeia archaeon]